MNQSEDNTSVPLTDPNDRQYQLDDKVHTTSNTLTQVLPPAPQTVQPTHPGTIKRYATTSGASSSALGWNTWLKRALVTPSSSPTQAQAGRFPCLIGVRCDPHQN
jgi:hypothetical protein